tara:strand:+ start:937 stop:1200 length:264 start_codon:yes stop_codon:yes gene_type:complete
MSNSHTCRLNNLPEDLQQKIWQNVWQNQMKTIDKEIKIEFVLKQFRAMYGDAGSHLRESLIKDERQKLQNHEKYYRYWCENIESWCD